MRNHITFREILSQTAESSSKRLVERARVASSVAKVARGLASRRAAYAVKRAALEHGVARFPERFELSGIEDEGRLVRVKFGEFGCLHLPVSSCKEVTRDWIARESRRVLRSWDRHAA